MAIAVTPVAGASYSVSNKKCRVLDLVFSGNYATGGEALTAAACGLKKIDQVIIHGGAMLKGDVTLGNPVSYNPATGKIVVLEGSAAGTALSEKTNAEAFETGSFVRVSVIGF